jgi:hypothetical protein
MPSIDLRTLLHAFAMASGAPPVAWQATGPLQAAAGETGQNLPTYNPRACGREAEMREVNLQHGIGYLRQPWLVHLTGR